MSRLILKIVVAMLLFCQCDIALAQSLDNATWQWAKQYGGIEDQTTRRIRVDQSGNVYALLATGYEPVISGTDTLPGGVYGTDASALLKYSPDGQLLYAKRITIYAPPSSGGTYYFMAGDMAIDNSGNTYLAGTFSGTTLRIGANDSLYVPTNANFFKQFLIKLNAQGNIVWKKYGIVPSISPSYIAADKSGDMYLLSRFTGYGGTSYGFDNFSLQATEQSGGNFFIAKFRGTDGQAVWLKNGFTGSTTTVNGLSVDTSKNLYLAMQGNGLDINGTLYTVPFLTNGSGRILLKMNPSGTFVWAKGMNPGPTFKSITNDREGNLYVSGNFSDTLKIAAGDYLVNNRYPGISRASFVLSYNPAGDVRWSRVFYNLNGIEASSSLAVDDNKNCYVTMENGGTVYTGNDTIPVNSNYQTLVSILKFDSTGAFSSHKNTSSTIYARALAYTIAADGEGNIYTGGAFWNSAGDPLSTFNIGADAFHSIDFQDAFFAKLKIEPLTQFDSLGQIAWCTGDSASVPIRYNNTLVPAGVQLRLILSAANGYFNNTTQLSALSATAAGIDTFRFVVPSSLTAGNNYKMRIEVSEPAITSLPYGSSLSLAAPPSVPVISESNGVLSCSLSGFSYQWYKDEEAIPGATGQTYQPSEDGNYQVKATNVSGCSSLSAVYPYGTNGIAAAFKAGAIKIYPNPFHHQLTVSLGTVPAGTSYSILSLLGTVVAQGTLTSKDTDISLNQVAAGVYFLKIKTGNENVTVKLLKKD